MVTAIQTYGSVTPYVKGNQGGWLFFCEEGDDCIEVRVVGGRYKVNTPQLETLFTVVLTLPTYTKELVNSGYPIARLSIPELVDDYFIDECTFWEISNVQYSNLTIQLCPFVLSDVDESIDFSNYYLCCLPSLPGEGTLANAPGYHWSPLTAHAPYLGTYTFYDKEMPGRLVFVHDTKSQYSHGNIYEEVTTVTTNLKNYSSKQDQVGYYLEIKPDNGTWEVGTHKICFTAGYMTINVEEAPKVDEYVILQALLPYGVYDWLLIPGKIMDTGGVEDAEFYEEEGQYVSRPTRRHYERRYEQRFRLQTFTMLPDRMIALRQMLRSKECYVQIPALDGQFYRCVVNADLETELVQRTVNSLTLEFEMLDWEVPMKLPSSISTYTPLSELSNNIATNEGEQIIVGGEDLASE